MGMFVDQPRVILVTRKTLLRKVSEKHGTREQARFYAKMKSASKAMAMLESADDLFNEAMRTVQSAIPPEWRRTVVEREELDRFLFAPDDLIVIVGQDGLVPNTAKYLDGQLVIGINPDPQRYDGVLCPHRAGDMAKLMQWVSHRSAQFAVRKRIMGAATREDGQVLLSLNEIFVGSVGLGPFDGQPARHRGPDAVAGGGETDLAGARAVSVGRDGDQP